MFVYDIRGKAFDTRRAPQRIVSLVPSLTETLFAFGAGNRVVGVTDYCIYPADGVATKTKIGGTKNPRVPDILALAPDLVIANVEENQRRDIEALEAQGVPTFITFPQTVQAAIAELEQLAQLVSATDAQAIIQPIEAAIARCRPAHTGRRVFTPIWRDPWMTANGETYMGNLIETCGGINVFRERTRQFRRPEPGRDARYPHVQVEEIAAAKPEVILLPDEPYPFTEKDAAGLRGITSARTYLVDGTLVSWYGVRMARAIETLRPLLEST